MVTGDPERRRGSPPVGCWEVVWKAVGPLELRSVIGRADVGWVLQIICDCSGGACRLKVWMVGRWGQWMVIVEGGGMTVGDGIIARSVIHKTGFARPARGMGGDAHGTVNRCPPPPRRHPGTHSRVLSPAVVPPDPPRASSSPPPPSPRWALGAVGRFAGGVPFASFRCPRPPPPPPHPSAPCVSLCVSLSHSHQTTRRT